MIHTAYIWKKAGVDQRPWHVECSCGPAGDFDSELQATLYIESHFNKLTGVYATSLNHGNPKDLKNVKPAAGKSYTPGKPLHESAPAKHAQTYTPKVAEKKEK